MDSWGDPTDAKYAAVTIEHEVSRSARLVVSDDSVAFRFGTVYLGSCIDVGVSFDRVCMMALRVGDRVAMFNVLERDGTVAPVWSENGASKLLLGLVLLAVVRGDEELRVRLDFAGRGDVVFRFPLRGACDALATLGLVTPSECDSGEADEPVPLGTWQDPENSRSEVTLTYHEPTENVSFWILRKWWSSWDVGRRTHEWPMMPGHFRWKEVASTEEGSRRFEPWSGSSTSADYLVVAGDGTARGLFGDEPFGPFEPSRSP